MECIRRRIKESRGSVRLHDETSYNVLSAELRRDAHSAFPNTKESGERPDSRSLCHSLEPCETQRVKKKSDVARLAVAQLHSGS